MIKIFIPQNKGRNKTSARGFWKNPSGKLYYDYLNIQKKNFKTSYDIQKIMNNLKKLYNQEAIFYIEDGFVTIGLEDGQKAFIFNSKKDITELTQKTEKIIPKEKSILKKELKKFLKLYNGATVYIEPLCYRLEAWSI